MKRTRKRWASSIGDDFLGTVFGQHGQLEVVAWCGERNGGNKIYTIFCSHCANDEELYGLGLFLLTKSKVLRGDIPCGCSKNEKPTQAQWEVKVRRLANERGYSFLGWYGGFDGVNSKLLLLDCRYGLSNSLKLRSFLRGCDCLLRKPGKITENNRQEDSAAVSDFKSTGSFHPATSFARIDRLDKNGFKVYWSVCCFVCGETYEATGGNLKRGCRGCKCSKHKPTIAYINAVGDKFIKFGITSNNPKLRMYNQSRMCCLKISNLGSWRFDDVSACRAAEQECIRTLETGVITKSQMQDGYTETTYAYNLQEVVDIYEKFGGIEVL